MKTVEIPEVSQMQLCYEECKEGLIWEEVYTAVHDEDTLYGWIIDHESEIIRPVRLMFDGMIYPWECSEDKLKELIGINFNYHKNRAEAVLTLSLMSPEDRQGYMNSLKDEFENDI